MIEYFEPLLAALLIVTPLLLGIAWVLQNTSIIPAMAGRDGALMKTWLPVAVMLGVIMLFSTAYFSAANTFTVLRWIVEEFAPAAAPARSLTNLNTVIRWAAHLGVYGLFFLIASNGPFRTRRGWALGLCLAVAIIDEFHQSLVPGRSGLVSDVVIDFAGACIADLADLAVAGRLTLNLYQGAS